MMTMRVAALQLNSQDDPAANRQAAGDLIEQAARGGARLVALPRTRRTALLDRLPSLQQFGCEKSPGSPVRGHLVGPEVYGTGNRGHSFTLLSSVGNARARRQWFPRH